MQELWEGIRWLLEPREGPQSFSTIGMCLRAAGVFIGGWAMLRIGGNRFLGRATQDGRPLEEALRRHRVSAGDLEEALRLKAHLWEPGQVQEARFERNGEISVVGAKERREPRILEVRVQEGVQTVRIEIG